MANQGEYDLMELLSIASRLRIRVTRAVPTDEIFACWADRVLEAAMFERQATWPGRDYAECMDKCRDMVEAANQYAV